MHFELAINPFDAAVPDMVDAAVVAERSGADAVWVADHFSGAIVGKSWSRDPFVCLGAIAVATESIDIGVLVANVVNRHPAQLASAVNSLQSLAPGRVRLGVGSGAAPRSRFAAEHEAIGRTLATEHDRRRHLVDYIGALRAIWNGDESYTSHDAGFVALSGVVDEAMSPPIIVGASAWPTIEQAVRVADGVNIRMTSSTIDHLHRLERSCPPGFDVSVLDWLTIDDAAIAALGDAGCGRLILGVSAPFDLDMIASVLERHLRRNV